MWTSFSVVLYLIYERTSKEPDDLLDGFVAFYLLVDFAIRGNVA
jgi:hypothetical protein